MVTQVVHWGNFVYSDSLIELCFVCADKWLSQGAEFVQDYTKGPYVTLHCVCLPGLCIEKLRSEVEGSADFGCIFDLKVVLGRPTSPTFG